MLCQYLQLLVAPTLLCPSLGLHVRSSSCQVTLVSTGQSTHEHCLSVAQIPCSNGLLLYLFQPSIPTATLRALLSLRNLIMTDSALTPPSHPSSFCTLCSCFSRSLSIPFWPQSFSYQAWSPGTQALIPQSSPPLPTYPTTPSPKKPSCDSISPHLHLS